ncbi:MAG: tRNA lysidine(34) synthetase TilS [Chlorobiaceae bacterium]|nr:tRNA lysidine(34) synthetase TilS [Chlorobiaceae bacterium]
MDHLERKFLENLRQRQLAEAGDVVLVAVSGGADSMALLALLMASRPVVGYGIAVAHANFGLRGEASDGDEEFVKEVCRRLGVECHTLRFDARGDAETWRRSLEETARMQRYGFFDELCEAFGYTRVATGHHAGDNAETMLFNLFRGTSPGGFRGIRAVNGRIVRPLLPFGREELAAYLDSKGITWRTDATNLDTVHDRNFIRHRVIPVVEERFRDKLMPSLRRMAEHAGELDEFVELYLTRLIRGNPLLDPEGGRLHVVTLLKLTPFEQKELLKRAVMAKGAPVDSQLLQRLTALIRLQPGRVVQAGRGISVVKRDGFLVFGRRDA